VLSCPRLWLLALECARSAHLSQADVLVLEPCSGELSNVLSGVRLRGVVCDVLVLRPRTCAVVPLSVCADQTL
jgi:hypothetical protein